ncbi:MAG: myo-inositol catabolism protein IolH [Acidobacteria bacterium]|nr:MAG: myo-inositol catabolism protein IolH [Acidobacteriota bacterium]
MVKLAAFPKCFMDQLCVDHSMTLFEWIEMASSLKVDGLEFYSGFVDALDPVTLGRVRRALLEKRLEMPMLCYSPNFTMPDAARRKEEVARENAMIDLTAYFGGKYCRILSGQAYPEISHKDGVQWVVGCIRECLEHAAKRGVVLIMENHYKDNYWHYPEFAQKREIFLEIVDQINSPWFGVNFDPSNAIVAGEDPLVLLRAVKHKVVTMHASDRYLESGSLEDLKAHEGNLGYASNLKHGVIGKGLNNYDEIFSILREAGFNGWVSIEDGVNGMDELHQSVAFLRQKLKQYFN